MKIALTPNSQISPYNKCLTVRKKYSHSPGAFHRTYSGTMSYSSLSPSHDVDTRTWVPSPELLRRSCHVINHPSAGLMYEYVHIFRVQTKPINGLYSSGKLELWCTSRESFSQALGNFISYCASVIWSSSKHFFRRNFTCMPVGRACVFPPHLSLIFFERRGEGGRGRRIHTRQRRESGR